MTFKGLSMKQITPFFLEGESPTLKALSLSVFLGKKKILGVYC